MTEEDPEEAVTPRWVVTVAIAGTLLLALGAFWLSFLSLQDLAHRSGLPAAQAWVWPLIVDGVIVEATIAVVSLRRAASSRARAFAWILLACGAGVSVAANITHATVEADQSVPSLVAAVVSAVPPLVLLAMTHLTVLLARRPTTGGDALPASVPELPATSGDPAGTRARAPQPRRSMATDASRASALELHRQGKSARQIADAIGVHRTTVARWVNAPDQSATPAAKETSP